MGTDTETALAQIFLMPDAILGQSDSAKISTLHQEANGNVCSTIKRCFEEMATWILKESYRLRCSKHTGEKNHCGG